MNTRKITSISTGLALALTIAIPAFAKTGTPMHTPPVHTAPAHMQGQGRPGNMASSSMVRQGLMGTVTAVSGNTISLSGRQGFGTSTTVTNYSVDATNATIRNRNASSTVSSINVGDRIFVQGKITGTNVVANIIFAGLPSIPNRNAFGNASSTSSTSPAFFGNNGRPGQPGNQPGYMNYMNGSTTTEKQAPKGFFGGIGQFFKHLFGF